jgi:hypothetical protein
MKTFGTAFYRAAILIPAFAQTRVAPAGPTLWVAIVFAGRGIAY